MTESLIYAAAICICASLSVSPAGADKGQAGRLALDRCTIVAGRDRASYVSHMINDIKGYLEEITGGTVAIRPSLDGTSSTFIVVGSELAKGVMNEPLPANAIGDQGYLIKSVAKGGKQYVIVAGTTDKGTRNGLAALARMIRADGKRAYIEAPVDIAAKPSMSVRGLHFNGWMCKSPYSFRTWNEAEWKRYIDMLGYQQVNLLYIWPFKEIIPEPLSPEDEEYLREVRRVADYAQKRHGMEVWVMQAPNRVAKNNLGIADPRYRLYWRDVQEDKNPGDPGQLKEIMQSHETMYRIINNVEGICTIDCDPGGWPDSPIEDFMRVFKGDRSLVDKYSVYGRETKLINWMWFGWGKWRVSDPKLVAETIQAMKSSVPEPWWLIAGFPGFLPVCKEEGVLEKTVFFPYGVIEGEPSYPGTNLSIEAVGSSFDVMRDYPSLAGRMGNTQTPMLQFPHIFHLLQCTWDIEKSRLPEREVLLQISELLYPESKQLIADCFASLPEKDVSKLAGVTAKLDTVMREKKLGRPGLLGRKLFPNTDFVAQSLLQQLRLQLSLERIYGLKATASRQECARLMEGVLDSYLAWDTAHGWHEVWPDRWPLGRFEEEPRFRAAVKNIAAVLKYDEASTDSFCDGIGGSLAAKYNQKSIVQTSVDAVRKAIKAVVNLQVKPNLATQATVSASVAPTEQYPLSFVNDLDVATLYWPGVLVTDNNEWIQLAWEKPLELESVTAYFLRHDSMWNRTIHLQKEVSPGKWEDIATQKPKDEKGCAIVEFKLPSRMALSAVRIVNLIDVYEIEVR